MHSPKNAAGAGTLPCIVRDNAEYLVSLFYTKGYASGVGLRKVCRTPHTTRRIRSSPLAVPITNRPHNPTDGLSGRAPRGSGPGATGGRISFDAEPFVCYIVSGYLQKKRDRPCPDPAQYHKNASDWCR